MAKGSRVMVRQTICEYTMQSIKYPIHHDIQPNDKYFYKTKKILKPKRVHSLNHSYTSFSGGSTPFTYTIAYGLDR